MASSKQMCSTDDPPYHNMAPNLFDLFSNDKSDEPSNHLDRECVEALSDELGGWGGEAGALVVISHDQSFCKQIDFTHVVTVADGKCLVEERSVRDSDWHIESMAGGEGSKEGATNESSSGASNSQAKIDPKLRKQIFNAPKRIAKLEDLIDEAETQIADIDEEMLAAGNDVGQLVDLNEKKEKISKKVEQYMEEWEELEALLAQVA